MRKTVFGIVFAVHILGMLLFSLRAPQQRTGGVSRTMTALILEEQRPEPAGRPPTAAPPPLRNIGIRPPEELPSVIPEEALEPGAGTSLSITDFSTSAHNVADEIARRKASQSYRSLDRQIQATPEKKRDPSIFALPQHEANTTEHFDGGGDRYYVSGNCFYDFDREPPPVTDMIAGPKLKVPTCKPPPGSGNHEMFKDLTPESLKKLPGTKLP